MTFAQTVGGLILFFLILVGPVPLGLFLLFLIQREGPALSSSSGALVLGDMWCLIEVSIGIFLGLIHLLNLRSLLVAEAVIGVVGIGLIWFARGQVPFPSLEGLFRENIRATIVQILLVGTVSCVGLLLLWKLASQPITDEDSLAYHLPTIAQWYQRGQFIPLEQFDFRYFTNHFGNTVAPVGERLASQISRYPYSWETLCLLFLLPFNNDLLVALPNLFAWMLLGMSVFLLSMRFGAEGTHSLGAACLILTLPIVLEQVTTLHVDLPFAAFFFATLWFAAQFNRTRAFPYLALFLANLGMLLGIKTSGIAYGGLLVFALVVMEIEPFLRHRKPDRHIRDGYRTSMPYMLGGGIWGLFLGGFWYIKNYLEVGNPLGYINVQFANLVLFPGVLSMAEIAKTSLASLFRLSNLQHWQILVEQIGLNLSTPFLAMILPVILLPFTLIFARRKLLTGSFPIFLMLLIGTGLLYWTTPYSGDNGENFWKISPFIGQALRYAFPFVGLLGIASAVGISSLRVREEITEAIVLLSVAPSVTLKLVQGNFKAFFFILTVGIVLLLASELTQPFRRFGFAPGRPRFQGVVIGGLGLVVFIALIFPALYIAGEKREGSRNATFGGLQQYVDSKVPPGTSIGYLYSITSYLFYGTRFDKRVVYAPTSKSDSLESWVDSLRKREVSVIAIGPLEYETNPREMTWLNDPSGPFTRLYAQDGYYSIALYELK